MARLELPTGHIALIDDGDLAIVESAGPWRVHINRHTVYVRRSPTSKSTQYLHTFLTGFPMTDHRNGDGLDNRRDNLRWCDASLNQANRIHLTGRSGYRGVTRHRTGRWQAAIAVHGQRRYLGLFDTAEQAARAYDIAALAAWGTYARPNFPTEVSS